jgi:hypothetical protein
MDYTGTNTPYGGIYMQLKAIHMAGAQVALDLGDGSERGEYVNQDYILHTLGKPHRAINLMYCYYPLDAGWPARASNLPVPDGKTAGFAWDYQYDDYFPFHGDEPFDCIRDIRRHGQDVILTLTCDCAVPDDMLADIADKLAPFGRLMLRINHEATGNWFAFNKRYTYQEVADFYVRFHKIIKERAPHIRTVLCIAEAKPENGDKMHYEDEFAEAIAATDMYSGDTYVALHWGWPFDIAEPGGTTHKRVSNESVFEGFNFAYSRFLARSGNQHKPFVISEFNADGDVTGPFEQASQLTDFYRQLPTAAPCVTGVTYYQFRDRGRLGLEIEDPNNPAVGIPQPMLAAYKKIMAMPEYMPRITEKGDAAFPAKLRWGGAEDADGIAIELEMESRPTFCEIIFDDADASLNLMLELNGHWFYKKPGVKHIDMMSAFFSSEDLPTCLRIFAPPATGENDPTQGEGWQENYCTTMLLPPTLRIRYTPTAQL